MAATQAQTDWGLVERLHRFFKDYYKNDIGRLAERYPNEQRHLTVDWSDLHQWDADFADDYLDAPGRMDEYLTLALAEYDLPVPVTLEGVDVRVVGLNEKDVYSPLELSKADPDGYVGIKGDLAKVTVPKDELEEAAFECQRCGSLTVVPQTAGFQEPYECKGCERQGPFTIAYDESSFGKFCKVRVETPPDEHGDLQSQHLDGYVRGDLVWAGHEEFGVVARSGDSITIYGTITREQRTRNKQKTRLFDTFLDVRAIEFDTDADAVDVAAHRETFEDFAAREDAPDVFARSLAPSLYATPAWEVALELLVAYLFGAPRIAIEGGRTYRGDIHALLVSDYGMGKSMVAEAVARFSPQCINESVTGMASDVGLLAAAVRDDFGEDQWTLEPGVLVRANGGHVILDEIDKTDADLSRMNDALEGEQVVDVNKAGQSATYNSKVGLLAMGNPKESRFDPHKPISEQLGIDQSLLSRFDGIVTMSDQPDEETDAAVAETQGLGYVEAAEYAFGDREELDRLAREVPVEVGRAWIAYAREHHNPIPTREQAERIKEWYATDARQLNSQFNGDDRGGDMPVPVTARVVPATMRFASAFARVHLRDRVADEDVERAMALSKALIGQNFDGEKFVPQETRPRTQRDRKGVLRDIIDQEQPADGTGGASIESVLSIAVERNMDREKAEHEIEQMRQRGELYEPATGEVRTT